MGEALPAAEAGDVAYGPRRRRRRVVVVVLVAATLLGAAVLAGQARARAGGAPCIPERTREVPVPAASAAPDVVVTALVQAINAGDDQTIRALMTPAAWKHYSGNGNVGSPSTLGQICSLDDFRVTLSEPWDPQTRELNLPEYLQVHEVDGQARFSPKTVWSMGRVTPHQEFDGIAGDDPDYSIRHDPEVLESFAPVFTLVRQRDDQRWLVHGMYDNNI